MRYSKQPLDNCSRSDLYIKRHNRVSYQVPTYMRASRSVHIYRKYIYLWYIVTNPLLIFWTNRILRLRVDCTRTYQVVKLSSKHWIYNKNCNYGFFWFCLRPICLYYRKVECGWDNKKRRMSWFMVCVSGLCYSSSPSSYPLARSIWHMNMTVFCLSVPSL